jgi:hypothetical protein
MAQAYATSFGWARAHPMKRKGDAHETLSLVFQHDGVLPTMVTDDSKEQTKGEFRRKLKEADCHPRVTEPYSPWQQVAEGCIRELKRRSSRKMIKTGSPKCLWDHCLELEAYVRSCTSNDIYMTGCHRVQLVRWVAQEPLVRGSNPSGARVQWVEGC